MKRLLSLFLVLAMTFSLVGCGSDTPQQSTPNGDEPQQSENNGAVQVDENLLTVDVTIPESFFDEDMTTFDPEAYAKENDFKSATVNEDGSVTITMSKSRHKKLMADLAESLDSAFEEMVGAEDTPYITSIDHSANFDSVDLFVDKAGYDDGGLLSAFLPLTVYFSAGMYQVFDGTKAPKCEISIIDETTGEVLVNVIYPDALESFEDDDSEEIVFDDSNYITDEIVIIDDDICTMKITEIDPNGDWGFTFKVYCENKTNHAVGFYIDYASVNGYMCDPYWGTELPAGKKENGSFEFSHSTLRDLGVTSLDELELGLRILNADDWSADPFVDDVYTIYPTGLAASDVVYADRTHMPDEVVCVDDDNCTFVILSVDADGDWGYTLKCYLENKTDSMMQFYWDDVAVNGFMVDPYWGHSVAAGKRCYSEISFSQSQLDENSITTIDEIEFNLRVSNEDDWDAAPYVDTRFSYKPVK